MPPGCFRSLWETRPSNGRNDVTAPNCPTSTAGLHARKRHARSCHRSGGDLYVVLSGCVAVCRSGSLITELRMGEHFGEMSLLRDQPRSAQALVTRLADLLVIPRRAFFECCAASTSWA